MSSAPSAVPKVGVAVFCLNSQGDFLLGKRKGSNGHNSWGLPGGHLELGEEFEECAAREVMEEVGLELRNVRFVTAVNNVFAERQHYVTIFLAGNVDGEPQVRHVDHWSRRKPISRCIGDCRTSSRTNAKGGSGYLGQSIRTGLGSKTRIPVTTSPTNGASYSTQ